MIHSVILNMDEYNDLMEKAKQRTVIISIKGLERNWEYLSYFESSKYAIDILKFDDQILPVIDGLKEILKSELDELNSKIKEYTNLKGEIEILKKEMK